jgi:hypothetical protein
MNWRVINSEKAKWRNSEISFIFVPKAYIQHPVSSIQHPASSIQHPASNNHEDPSNRRRKRTFFHDTILPYKGKLFM